MPARNLSPGPASGEGTKRAGAYVARDVWGGFESLARFRTTYINATYRHAQGGKNAYTIDATTS